MFCSPPSPRPTVSPVEAFKSFPDDLVFYQEYFARPGTAAEIMQDIRGYLTGLYYSVSGACSDDEQWRALWKKGSERFEDTYTVPVAGVHEPTGDGLCRQRIHSPRHPGRTQLVRCGASASTIFQ
jgi:hypothetical protein